MGSETTINAFGPKASLYTEPCCKVQQTFNSKSQTKEIDDEAEIICEGKDFNKAILEANFRK